MRKPKFDDPDDLKRQIEEYFEKINEPDEEGNKRPPTLSGLALHLKTTRCVLNDYISAAKDEEEKNRKRAQCGELLILAKARIECYLEEKLISGYSKGLEFVLQNGYHGWGAKSTTTISGEVDVRHKGGGPVIAMTDEELLRQINLLTAKVGEIYKREGIRDGADGE